MSVGIVVSGLMFHAYMGTVFPEEKPAFFSMLTGDVNELHVYNHHFKWWLEMKLSQQAWMRQRDEQRGLAASGDATGTEVQDAPPAPGATAAQHPGPG